MFVDRHKVNKPAFAFPQNVSNSIRTLQSQQSASWSQRHAQHGAMRKPSYGRSFQTTLELQYYGQVLHMFVAMYLKNVPFNVSSSTVTSSDRKPASAGHNARQRIFCVLHIQSWNLGTLTSWNPLGHSRPVTGLLFLHIQWDTTIFHLVVQ